MPTTSHVDAASRTEDRRVLKLPCRFESGKKRLPGAHRALISEVPNQDQPVAGAKLIAWFSLDYKMLIAGMMHFGGHSTARAAVAVGDLSLLGDRTTPGGSSLDGD